MALDRDYWEGLAGRDPLWAVLSDPAKAGRRWNLTEFMRTGEREIALLCFQLAQNGIVRPTGVVLDFGCGVGRLTQALAVRSDRAIGIDVSERMVTLARRLNRHGDRVQYLHNDTPDLALLPTDSVDFIYSNITLQHIPPAQIPHFLREFMRVLRHDGLLVFQLPSHIKAAADITTRPMPDAAYRAGITLLHEPPRQAAAGAAIRLTLQIANDSNLEWRQPEVGSLRLGNHWLDGNGAKMLIQDDAREVVPQTFAPQERFVSSLVMTAPATAGPFVAEIDLVHEGVTWFSHKGSRTLRLPMTITPASTDEAPAPLLIDERTVEPYDASALADLLDDRPASDPVDFPMHGIVKREVLELMTSTGGRVLQVEHDPRAGSEWESYRYSVRKI